MEQSLTVNIAGFFIKLLFHENKGKNVRKMFVSHFKRTFFPYLEPNELIKADVELEVVEREKILGKDRIEKNGKIYAVLLERKNGKKTIFYDMSTSQVQEIIRRLTFEGIYNKGGLIIHASSVLSEGKADLFIAPSGGGKTTILKKLSPILSPFTDDAVLLRKTGDKYRCYQIPFADQYTHHTEPLKNTPLGNIYFIHKAKENRIKQISVVDAVGRLLTRSIREEKMVKNALSFCSQYSRFFDLYFSQELGNKQLLKLIKDNSR